MKLFDREKGKILGTNAIDLFVIAVIIFLGFMVASTVLKSSLSYDGEEVYKAVKAYNKLNGKGFLVELVATGRDVGNPYAESKEKTGVVKRAYGGTLVVENEYGEVITVGGSMSYIEIFAAEKVELKPRYSSVVFFYLPEREFPSFDSFLRTMKEIRKSEGAEHLVMDGRISTANPNMNFSTFKEEIEDCHLCISSSAMKIESDYYAVEFQLTDLNELSKMPLSSGRVKIEKGFVLNLGYPEELEREEVSKIYSSLIADGYLRNRSEASYVSTGELF